MALNRKTMILFDENLYKRLLEKARQRGESVGAFVREAVEKALAEEDRDAAGRIAAARRIVEAAEDVPDWRELERSLLARYGE